MKWLQLGMKVFPYLVMAVQSVEKLAGAKKGKEKQDAAIDLIGTFLASLEGGLDKDLLDDGDVQIALRAAIDAYVALQNVIVKARAAAA